MVIFVAKHFKRCLNEQCLIFCSSPQLESGAIFYEHQMPEEPFWVVRDSVELLLSSPPAPAVHHVLPITVSYYAASHNVSSQLWKNKGR